MLILGLENNNVWACFLVLSINDIESPCSSKYMSQTGSLTVLFLVRVAGEIFRYEHVISVGNSFRAMFQTQTKTVFKQDKCLGSELKQHVTCTYCTPLTRLYSSCFLIYRFVLHATSVCDSQPHKNNRLTSR